MRIEFIDRVTGRPLFLDFHKSGGSIVIHLHDYNIGVIQEVSFPRRIAWQVCQALDLLAPKKGRKEE